MLTENRINSGFDSDCDSDTDLGSDPVKFLMQIKVFRELN